MAKDRPRKKAGRSSLSTGDIVVKLTAMVSPQFRRDLASYARYSGKTLGQIVERDVRAGTLYGFSLTTFAPGSRSAKTVPVDGDPRGPKPVVEVDDAVVEASAATEGER